MTKSLLILLGISCLALVACNGTQNNHTITLSKNNLELEINEVETLTTYIEPEGIEDPSLIWVISNNNVVSVVGGLVTALNEGTTEIAVYLDINKNNIYDVGEPGDFCTVTVVEAILNPVSITNISLNKASTTLAFSNEESLTATITPSNADTSHLKWKSSNSSVANVRLDESSTSGVISSVDNGNCQITVYDDQNNNSVIDFEEVNASCTVTVTKDGSNPEPDETIWVSNVALNTTHLSIEEDDFDMVYVTVSPSNATHKTVTWFSSNAGVATVSNGRITAINVGAATITAYVDENGNAVLDDELRDTVDITVTEKVEDSDPTGDRIPASGENLPIGNTAVSGPENAAPVDISDWINYDLFSSLPEYWSFIMGNNKAERCSDFYAESSGGSFKFSHSYYGLQSRLLTSWLKTEVRLTVSQIHGNCDNQKQYDGKPIFHIYSYDETGHYLEMQTYERLRYNSLQ